LNPEFSKIVERILEVRDNVFSDVPVVIYTNSSRVCENSVIGLGALRKCTSGELAVDIMLVEIDEETNLSCLEELSEALREIQPHRVYVQTPTKPPFETSVKSVANENIIKSAKFIREKTGYDVSVLLGMNPPMSIEILANWRG
jgi:wyosine [tRNA(Phe)-imidazoG37] synthetase (radical SAM superfamily)